MEITIVMEAMPVRGTNLEPRKHRVSLVGIGNYVECSLLMKVLKFIDLIPNQSFHIDQKDSAEASPSGK